MSEEEFMAEIEGYRKIDNEFQDIIKTAFPGIKFEGAGNIGNDFRAYISKDNSGLFQSEYYYKDRLKFFHLTSIRNVFSILNSRSVRMYDLHSSEDVGEYQFAGRAMGLHDNYIENQKSRLFTFSFSPFKEISNRHLWEKYGSKLSGAALVFEIINDPKNWINYHLAEVKYQLPKELETFLQKMEAFKKKYNITADFDPSRLIGFHKKMEFEKEKEVRLVTYAPHDDNLQRELKHIKIDYRTEEGRNRITQYFDLPFWVDNKNLFLNEMPNSPLDRAQNLPAEYFDAIPKIKIVDVLVGAKSGLEHADLQRLKSRIEEIFSFQYGYDVKLTDTLFDV